MKKSTTADIARYIRRLVLTSTTKAASGHPSTCLSATDLMTVLFAKGFFKYDVKNPKHPGNDRLIFSKGHAAPLLYALWALAGAITVDELMTLRQFGSRIEGHPTSRFPYAEAATGSLGQGLSVGVGLAIAGKYLDRVPYKTFVLLGDGELMEGSVWEAASIASHYKLNNLIAIADINRLGQSGATAHQWDMETYKQKFSAFGWGTIVLDGHDMDEISRAYASAVKSKDKPTILLAKTVKGKGVPDIENKNGWHGKALSDEQLERALSHIGPVPSNLTIDLPRPSTVKPHAVSSKKIPAPQYEKNTTMSTRKAYGDALAHVGSTHGSIVALDAETKNSTYSETFEKHFPERFFEMFIAEQNMVGTALGLSLRGKIPFIATFAAFWSRAFDQVRMTQYSDATIHIVGSHAGVSIGQDGSSQMGLEDISLFSSILNSVVMYPSDAYSTLRLVEVLSMHKGISYLRTTRMDTPLLYGSKESFEIGKSKTLRTSLNDSITIVAAGITVHEALKAHILLKDRNIDVRVIDAYSIKPIDVPALQKAQRETQALLVVEDHYPHGGLFTAVANALAHEQKSIPIHQLCVTKIPMSGTPEELMRWAHIDSEGIVKKVLDLIKKK